MDAMNDGVDGGIRTHTVEFLKLTPPTQLGYIDIAMVLTVRLALTNSTF